MILKNKQPAARRSLPKIATFISILLFVAAIQCKASLEGPRIGGARENASVSMFISQPHISRSSAQDASTWNLRNAQAFLSEGVREDLGITQSVKPLRVSTEFRKYRKYIALPPAVRFSADMSPGSTRVVRQGQRGVMMMTERITKWDTVTVSRMLVAHKIVQRPRAAVVVAGPPRNVAEAMAATKLRKLVAVFAMIATAYTADSARAYPTGRTATGLLARYGVVAVDPRIIPLGAHVFIPGYGIAIAADTGGAIIGNRIDLCMDSLGAALNFGRQAVKVYVLQE